MANPLYKAKFKKELLDDPIAYKEIVKEINRRYYQSHKQEHAKAMRDWQNKNPEKRLYNSIKYFSKKNDVDFNIDLADIVIPEYCPILGCKINSELGGGRRKNGPSVDRIDHTKGYVKGNIQVISLLANRMKNNATVEELLAFAAGVLRMYDPKLLTLKPFELESVNTQNNQSYGAVEAN